MKKMFVLSVLVSLVLAACSTSKAAPTRDPLVVQQATALAAIQTQLAQAKEPVVNDTPIPQPTPIQPAAAQGCRVIHESLVDEGMDHVSTSGNFIHLEFWWPGQPEKETIFTAADAAGGRFNFSRQLRGWVWEYSNCSFDEVKAQVDAHITRRLEGQASNAGFVPWDETGLFTPVPLSQP